jgi:hypothetical protein
MATNSAISIVFPAESAPIESDFVTCFNLHRDELLTYLVQRFGSITFSERVVKETRARLADANILLLVGNPRVYLMGYALSLGLQFLQEEHLHLNQEVQ